MAHGRASCPGCRRDVGTRIEVEILNGNTETVEVREALVERLQALSLEMSEKLDAYQKRHAPR
jgi:hypothetical protein